MINYNQFNYKWMCYNPRHATADCSVNWLTPVL